jgi:hypothetical protein
MADFTSFSSFSIGGGGDNDRVITDRYIYQYNASRNAFSIVKNLLDVETNGSYEILASNDVDVNTGNNVNLTPDNDIVLNSGNNIDVDSAGTININSGTTLDLESTTGDITLTSQSDINLDPTGDVVISGGNIEMDTAAQIGVTGDLNLITLDSGLVTVDGEVDATTVDATTVDATTVDTDILTVNSMPVTTGGYLTSSSGTGGGTLQTAQKSSSSGDILITSLGRAGGALVATTNPSGATPNAILEMADYVCDGTGDQTQIQAALNAYDKVYLAQGLYNCSADLTIPDETTLTGVGRGTEISVNNEIFLNANQSVLSNLLVNGATVIDINGNNCKVHDIWFYSTIAGTAGALKVDGDNAMIDRCFIKSTNTAVSSIVIGSGASFTSITNCHIHSNSTNTTVGACIAMYGQYVVISGCNIHADATNSGINVVKINTASGRLALGSCLITSASSSADHIDPGSGSVSTNNNGNEYVNSVTSNHATPT